MEKIKQELIMAFNSTDSWFNKPAEITTYKPATGWSVRQVLEHVVLTNHYLLLLIVKGKKLALKKSAGTEPAVFPKDYDATLEKLKVIGEHGSFEWMRPAHMEPAGTFAPMEVRLLLQYQLAKCLAILRDLPHGEGLFHTTTMSVNALGKLDVYQYIYFLAMHMKRHNTQMELLESLYFQGLTNISGKTAGVSNSSLSSDIVT